MCIRDSDIIMNTYKNYQHNPEVCGYLCKLHGILLSRLDKVDSVKFGLERLFTICHPEYASNTINLQMVQDTPDVIRNSVAEAYGYVASFHFDLVVDKIRQIFNSDILAKKSGGFNFFSKSSSSDSIPEHIKITLILCYGYACKYTNQEVLAIKIESHILNNIMPFLDNPNNAIKIASQKSLYQISKALEKVFDYDQYIQEDFKKFIVRTREKLLDKALKNFHNEKQPEFKLYSWMTVSSLMRLEPPLNKLFMIDFLNSGLNMIPNNKIDDKTLEVLAPGFAEMLHGLIHHDEVYQTSENDPTQMVSWWEILHLTVEKLYEKLDSVPQKNFYDLAKFFMDALLKALNNKKFFAQIFATFLIRISTAHNQFNANRSSISTDPVRQALWAFEQFLVCNDDKNIINHLESQGLLKKLVTNEYDDGIAELVHIYCKNSTFDQIKIIYDFLEPFLSKNLESQKLVTLITFSQFVLSSVHLCQQLNESLANPTAQTIMNPDSDIQNTFQKYSVRFLRSILSRFAYVAGQTTLSNIFLGILWTRMSSFARTVTRVSVTFQPF
eukprot:TRINITY_DN2498_c0_g1_i4.p1 TRINITY_DN2498_c0_g1~~TRINITY_DN2498_c0_g1_i4.p1  ORF type:complete len:555 (+),score=187.42 TRINITY_DN2498_c0_g1_i4:66-1730(+)